MQLLCSFTLIARPAFADMLKLIANKPDVTAATTANVETTADLVEMQGCRSPATNKNVGTTKRLRTSHNFFIASSELPVNSLQ